MFWGALLGIVVTMFLALIRGVKGPTVFDRILAVNNFGTNTVLSIAVAGFMMGIHDDCHGHANCDARGVGAGRRFPGRRADAAGRRVQAIGRRIQARHASACR